MNRTTALLLGSLLAFVPEAAPLAAAQARVELASDRHDLGEVRAGTKLAQLFELRNAGDATLFLKFSGADVPGITARAPREVPAGGAATIAIEWDTSRIEGELEAVIEYTTNDPARPTLSLALRTVAYRPISVEPYAAAFFSLWRGESGEQRLRIAVRDEPPARIVKLTPAGSRFAAEVETVIPGREYSLVVRVPPSTETGRFREHLTLETDHPEMPAVRVAVNVLVKPELFVGVEEVTFGELDPQLLGSRPDLLALLAQSFVVRRKEGPFEIVALESDLPALTLARDPATGAAEAFRIDVGIAAEKLVPGPLTGTIRIETSDPRFPLLVVPVKNSAVVGRRSGVAPPGRR